MMHASPEESSSRDPLDASFSTVGAGEVYASLIPYGTVQQVARLRELAQGLDSLQETPKRNVLNRQSATSLLNEISRSLEPCPESVSNADGKSISSLMKNLLSLSTPEREVPREFLKDFVNVSLRFGVEQKDYEFAGSCIRKALALSDSQGLEVIRTFAAESLPEVREAIVKIAGKAHPQLRDELLETVFDSWYRDTPLMIASARLDDGVAIRSLRLHDAVLLLKRVERLYDPEVRGYEEMVQPFRDRVLKDAALSLSRDGGVALMHVLERVLDTPPTAEERSTLLLPTIKALGSDKVNREAVRLFVRMPQVQAWFSEESGHSQTFPRPTNVRRPLVEAVVKAASESLTMEIPDQSTFDASIRLLRYLGRWQGHTGGTFLGSVDLQHLASPHKSLGEQEAAKLFYETSLCMLSVPSLCTIAVRAGYHLADRSQENSVVAPFIQKLLVHAAEIHPAVVLGEAASSSNPSQSIHRLVEALRADAQQGDYRASALLTEWSVLMATDSLETLLQGLPLSERQRVTAREILQQELESRV